MSDFHIEKMSLLMFWGSIHFHSIHRKHAWSWGAYFGQVRAEYLSIWVNVPVYCHLFSHACVKVSAHVHSPSSHWTVVLCLNLSVSSGWSGLQRFAFCVYLLFLEIPFSTDCLLQYLNYFFVFHSSKNCSNNVSTVKGVKVSVTATSPTSVYFQGLTLTK